MNCMCCGEPRNELIPSDCMLGGSNLLCKQCAKEDHEPRYVVLLAGRSLGLKTIKDHIRHRKYCGEDVRAIELMTQ